MSNIDITKLKFNVSREIDYEVKQNCILLKNIVITHTIIFDDIYVLKDYSSGDSVFIKYKNMVFVSYKTSPTNLEIRQKFEI